LAKDQLAFKHLRICGDLRVRLEARPQCRPGKKSSAVPSRSPLCGSGGERLLTHLRGAKFVDFTGRRMI
jgi:hypothetical protein